MNVITWVVSFVESLGVPVHLLIALIVLTFNFDFLELIKERLKIHESNLAKGRKINSTANNEETELGVTVYVFQGLVIALCQWLLRIIIVGLPWILICWMFTEIGRGPSALWTTIALVLSTILFLILGRTACGTYILYDSEYRDYFFNYGFSLKGSPHSRRISDLGTIFLLICTLISGIALEVQYHNKKRALIKDKFAFVDYELFFVCSKLEVDSKREIISLHSELEGLPEDFKLLESWNGTLQIPLNSFTSDLKDLIANRTDCYLIIKFGDDGKIQSLKLLNASFSSKVIDHQITPVIEFNPSSLWAISDKKVSEAPH